MNPTHGGARKGAGRKKSGRKSYLIRMKPEAMGRLRFVADPRPVGEYLEYLTETAVRKSTDGSFDVQPGQTFKVHP